MRKAMVAFIVMLVLISTSQSLSQDVVINFDDYTTSGAEGLPGPPGAYAGFVWEHVFWSSDEVTPRVVSNDQLAAWSAPRTATSGVYQLYVSESESKITITRSDGGPFNFVSAQFVKYNNSTNGATTIWITGYKNGGGTVSKSFSVTNSYQLKSYTDLINLSSLVITGGSSTARLWLMDDFTYNLDPEIDVQGNGVSIADGDDSPASADHTDFGEASVSGGTVVRTFTILNNGAGDLSLSGTPRVSVSPTTHFSVTSQPASATVVAGGSTTFQITFDPASEGSQTATVSIVNDDSDENPYTFDITGTGSNTAPEINVKQGETDIADGGTYGFGSQNEGTDTDAIFTIQNTGNASLTLSGSPIITLGGDDADQFSVQGQPSSPVAASGSTTFTIRFSPTSAGAKSATVAIANDDSDENPYDLTFTGTCLAPEINLKRGETSIASGGGSSFGSQATGYHTDVEFTIENLGTSSLTVSDASLSGTNADEFSIETQPTSPVAVSGTTTLTVRFSPTTTGGKTATLSIPNGDSNENPYTVTLTGTGVTPVPEIGLKQGTTVLADGGSFSYVWQTVGSNTDVEFSIENTGNGDLTLSGSPIIALGGDNADQFSVQVQPSSPVAPSGSTSFTIRFTPTSEGTKTATIAIVSDDSDENPYDLTLSGNATASTLVRFDDITTEAHGTVPGPYAGFDWHGSAVASDGELKGYGWTGDSPSGDYQVRVGETENVTITPETNNFNLTEIQISQYRYNAATSLTFTGTTSNGGTVVETAALSSMAYTRDTFSTLKDLTQLVITSNGAWLFDNFGYTLEQEIDVLGNGTSIAEGDDSPSATDHTNFGNMDTEAGSIVRTYTIKNVGSANLSLTGSPVVALSGSTDFTVTQQPESTTLAPSDSTTFQVSFNPSSLGTISATVSIQNSDSDENPYTFDVQGTGVSLPEMDVTGQDQSIADGDDSPSTSDDTDFGVVIGQLDHTFTILNSGSQTLSLTGDPKVVIGGAHASDFTVTVQPSTPVAASGGTVTFTVRFTPSEAGLHEATISIANDDNDENPYDFAIQGTGDVSLPVDLSSFSAALTSAGILVEWTTQSETDHRGFILERRDPPSNNDWQTIASYLTHEALRGQGNTSGRTAYSFVDANIELGLVYSYRLCDVNASGDVNVYDVIEIALPEAPEKTELQSPFPNPFNPNANITYRLRESTRVTITVFDILGRSIKTLYEGRQIAGSYHVYWNGTNEKGMTVPTGEYIIRMQTENAVQIQKVMFMK